MENSAPTLHGLDARNALLEPYIPIDEKYKFNVTCPGSLFMKMAVVPPEHEKYWVNGLWPGCTGMHYVTHRSQQRQNHKFVVMCLGALFMETTLGPPEHEK
jgi:hypothetical protein